MSELQIATAELLPARLRSEDERHADQAGALHSKDGKPVYQRLFQQSSFGNFTIANERFAVKVRNDAPIECVCALACGGQTGAGAVLNVMKPRAGDSFVVFGVGAVGLSGLMSAKIAGCDPIIAVDVHEHRLALARTLGATHTISITPTAPMSSTRFARLPVLAHAIRWKPRRFRLCSARRWIA